MEREQRKKKKLGHMDFPIFLMVTLLCAFGLIMVFSASYYYAQEKFNDGYYYISKQIIYIVIGFPIMLLLSRLKYSKLEKFKTVFLILSIVLLIAVLIFGKEANGAKRWLVIFGQSLQPSEVAKFGMMLYMCSFMARRQPLMHDFVKGVIPMLLVIGVICGLIMLQPNMSMAVIIALMGIALLFVGGVRVKHIVILLIAGVVLFLLFGWLEPYRMRRLLSFTNPWEDAKNTGYQLVQSFYALGSGGIFGQGLNNSRQKLLYMTYGESDFIFSIIGEELGLIGCVIVLLAYGFIIYRGIRIAMRCKERFGSLLAAGITIVLALQVIVNIGVVTGILPTTGQALPFVSAGGSSLLIFLASMGVLLNISRNTNEL